MKIRVDTGLTWCQLKMNTQNKDMTSVFHVLKVAEDFQ